MQLCPLNSQSGLCGTGFQSPFSPEVIIGGLFMKAALRPIVGPSQGYRPIP